MEEKQEFVPLWHRKEQPKRKEMPSSVLATYKDAKVNNAWIYHVKSRKWFTPDEFFDQWDSVYIGKSMFNNNPEFKIMNPLAAVRQRAQWVEKAGEELQSILKKLEDYSATFEKKIK